MKKTFILLLALLFIASGCGKDEEKQKNEEGQKVEEVSREETKEDNKEEEKKEEKKEETKKEETANNTETKKEETTKKPSINKNNTTTNNNNKTDTKQENTTKNEQSTSTEVKKEEVKPACTPKKFKNKYSYAYTDKATCMKEGNLKFLEISDSGDTEIFAYDCEEIVDDCGAKYYGVIFYKWNEEKGEYPAYY